MVNTEKRRKTLTAIVMIAPFLIAYATVFAYPVYKMFALSFTDAPLVGEGQWVGFDNYVRLFHQKLFYTSVWNTGYFVVLTVLPNTLIGLGLALMVVRLKGWMQSLVLVLFFIPYILPVSVVTQIWKWVLDQQFGIDAGGDLAVGRRTVEDLPQRGPAAEQETIPERLGENRIQ